MNPFDYSKAVSDFWTAQGQALMRAQEQAGKALAEGMKAVASGKLPMLPTMPTDLSDGAGELAQASKSVMDLWAAATAVCGKLATAFPPARGRCYRRSNIPENGRSHEAGSAAAAKWTKCSAEWRKGRASPICGKPSGVMLASFRRG